MREIAMRKIFGVVLVVALGVIFVAFAVANRHWVTVSFDPFVSADPSFSTTLPLFLVIILAAVLGVVAGGCATWCRQRRWRRAAPAALPKPGRAAAGHDAEHRRQDDHQEQRQGRAERRIGGNERIERHCDPMTIGDREGDEDHAERNDQY